MSDIEKLREVFLDESLDEETRESNLEDLKEWENTLRQNQALLNWRAHDITKQIFAKTRASYIDQSVHLALNRHLTEEQRKEIYARLDAMQWILSLGGDDPQKEIDDINQRIRAALNAT